MKLSPGEKLILVALADLAQPDKPNELDIGLIQTALLYGHTWVLEWEHSFLNPENETDPEVVSETSDILSMWRTIEVSFERLPADEQARVKSEAGTREVAFEGFDGNNDPHFGVASFLINDMGRFDRFEGRYLNSHSSFNLQIYRRMLPAYTALMKELGFRGDPLTGDQILSIMKA